MTVHSMRFSVCLSAALALFSLARAVEAKRTNVALVLCDDLTMQAVSAYRHPLKLLQTPNRWITQPFREEHLLP
jgi:hypothetical protein